MSIIEQTAQAAIRLLRATKAKFIVVLPDGTTYSEGDLRLEVAKPTAKRKSGALPYGTYSTMCKPYLDIAVGDVVEFAIPEGGTPTSLHSAVSAYFGQKWGNGAAKTYFNKATQNLELLRVE